MWKLTEIYPYLEDAAAAFRANDRVVLILQAVQFVVADVGEVVGVDGARGEANDHRPRGRSRHGSTHQL